MKKILQAIKTDVFYSQFMLIPIAVPLMGTSILHWRCVLIFGFRVAYWTVIA